MKNFPPLLGIFAFLIAAASAQHLSGVSIGNESAADEFVITAGGRIREFATSTGVGAVQTSGDTSSVMMSMRWYNGFHIPSSATGAALTHKRNPAFVIHFTIEDPTNRGYILTIGSLLRGYSSALWEGGTNQNAVVATGSTLAGSIDTDTSDGTDTLLTQIDSLTLDADSGVTANNGITFISAFGEDSETYAESFSGTRNFALRYTSDSSPTTNVFLQNNHSGQGSVRYGLENKDEGLDATGQTSTGQQEAKDLGLFVNLSATFNPVPEPSVSVFTLLSLGLAFVRRRK